MNLKRYREFINESVRNKINEDKTVYNELIHELRTVCKSFENSNLDPLDIRNALNEVADIYDIAWDWSDDGGINENSSEEVGEVILNVDGKKTTWFYLRDAILNGLLEETLDLSEMSLEEILDGAEWMEDIYTLEDLTDLLEEDFESTLDILIDHLLEIDHINEDKVQNIKITGHEEDSDDEIEDYEWSYEI